MTDDDLKATEAKQLTELREATTLHECIVPVVVARPDKTTFLHGTAFFVNAAGIFITAGHVINAAHADAKDTGGKVSLTSFVPGSIAGVDHPVVEYATTEDQFDVAVGRTESASKSFVCLAAASLPPPMGRDVMTFGYPETAMVRQPSGGIEVGFRTHKGYIVRPLPAGQSLMRPHPPCFELSFAVPAALSGAPLLLTPFGKASDVANPPGLVAFAALIGVCVGNQQAETVAFSHTEVDEKGVRFSEKTSKIELYGLAHDLRPLARWSPPVLKGAALADVIRPGVPL